MDTSTSAAGSPAGHVTLRYWASLRAAAGVEEEVVEVPGPVTLADLEEKVRTRHGPGRFTDVLGTCSVLVDDQQVANRDPATVMLRPGDRLDFLPPFAGG